MSAAQASVMARIVALVWAQGNTAGQADIHAMLGCSTSRGGSAIYNAIRAGHVQVLDPTERPRRLELTPERAAHIASLPPAWRRVLRAQAEALVRRARRVRAVRERAKVARRAKAAKSGPTAGQRPPLLPGSVPLVKRGGKVMSIVRALPRGFAPDAPTLDPHGLLQRASRPSETLPAPPAHMLLRGGALAPADGPYIRPDAAQADAIASQAFGRAEPHHAPHAIG